MESVLSCDQLISLHRAQPNVKPSPTSTLTYAFGNQTFEKMKRELSTDDNILRLKILLALNEELRDPYKVSEALNANILSQLFIAIKDDQPNEIRINACKCLIWICEIKEGRKAIIDNRYINKITAKFEDSEYLVRKYAYISLMCLSKTQFGKESVVDIGTITILVNKLVTEQDPEILTFTLRLLALLLNASNGPSVCTTDVNCIKRLKNLLINENNEIVMLTSLCLGLISIQDHGKSAVIKEYCVIDLANLLSNTDSLIRMEAVKALTYLTIDNIAKFQLIGIETESNLSVFTPQGTLDLPKRKYEYLDKIAELLMDDNEQTLLNVLQLISSLGEHPKAREYFKGCMPRLNELNESKNIMIKRFANIAIEVISWCP